MATNIEMDETAVTRTYDVENNDNSFNPESEIPDSTVHTDGRGAKKCTQTALETQEQQKIRYPRLSRVATDILSILAMSAEAERIFLGAWRQIPWSTASLGANTVEQMEFLKH
jgi:hAT family C-terminal dimerisation region